MRPPIHTVVGVALSALGHYNAGNDEAGFFPPAALNRRQPARIRIDTEHDETDHGTIVHAAIDRHGALWLVGVTDLPPPRRVRDDTGQRFWSVDISGHRVGAHRDARVATDSVIHRASIVQRGAAVGTGPLRWLPVDVRDGVPDDDADVWRFAGELRAVLATAHRDYTTRQPGEAITIIDLVGP